MFNFPEQFSQSIEILVQRLTNTTVREVNIGQKSGEAREVQPIIGIIEIVPKIPIGYPVV